MHDVHYDDRDVDHGVLDVVCVGHRLEEGSHVGHGRDGVVVCQVMHVLVVVMVVVCS